MVPFAFKSVRGFKLAELMFLKSTPGHKGNLLSLITAPPSAFIGDRECCAPA